MIQQIPLTGQINSIHTLSRSLNIQSYKSSIIPGCQLCRLSDNSSGCFLVTTDTSHKLLMPKSDGYSHHHFILHLFFYPQRHFLQSQLTQLKNILGSKEIIQCCLNLFRTIDLSRFQTGNQFFCRQVNIHHLIRFLKHTVGHPFFHFNPRNLLHFFIHAFDVLNIDCRNHIDSFIQQCHYILPTFLIQTSFHIGMCQFIHYHNFGMKANNRI